MDLKGFLKQNAIVAQNIKFVVSNRFLDENQKPIEWEFRAITSAEDEQLRKNAMRKISATSKRGQAEYELDTNKYIGTLAATCTVFPNLNDVDLQNNYGVMSADALLKAMLLPGEYANCVMRIQELCGFDVSSQELIDTAKN